MKQILFRADGNAQIGLGHVMRCLALAEMLGSEYSRRFALVQPSPELSALIEKKRMVTISLLTNEISEFLAFIQPDDVVVLDGYSFPETYQRVVRERAKRLVFIDDLVAGYQVADVVINHAGGVTEYDYQAEPYTRFLLGPRYALLRPAFFRTAPPTPAEGTIFVSLGGADPGNISLKVLDALRIVFRQLGQPWRVHLVAGPFHPNRGSLIAYQQHIKHLAVLDNLTAAQMVSELEECQLAIVACSTVAYETCAINRPMLPIQTADNQQYLAHFFSSDLLMRVLYQNELTDQFALAIQNALLHKPLAELLAKRVKTFFDGQSPERFRQLFARLCS